MPPIAALVRAATRLAERLEQLEVRLSDGDDAAWRAYIATAAALATIVPQTVPGADGRLLTTKELADALHVSSKTVLRKRRAGKLAAVQLGQRGRAALRWSAPRASA